MTEIKMIANWYKKNFFLISLGIIFFFLVTVKIFLSFRFPTPFVFGDEYLYADYTKEILQNPASFFIPKSDQIYPPGYPFILIPSFLLYPSVSAMYHGILATNIILSTGLLFITFCILKRYCTEEDAILGSILITLLPFVTINNYIVFSENLYIPALVLACLLLILSVEKNNPVLHVVTGFVIGCLPVIRTFGILALLSFYLIIIYIFFINKSRYQEFLKEKFFLIFTPLAAFCSYIFIKMLLSTKLSGYNSGGYFSALTWAMRDLPSFLIFLKAFAAEIDYLILTTYIGFIILAALLAFSWKKIDMPLKTFFLFTFFYTCFSVILTIIHMLTVLRATDSPQFSQYLIFGRYLDPAVPLIFMLGLIYACRYLPEQIRTANQPNDINQTITTGVWALPKELVWLFAGLGLFLIFTFPTELIYKVVNVGAIYYLDFLNQYSPYFFYAVPFLLFIPFLLLVRHPRQMIVIFILISLVITVPTFIWIERTSNNTNFLNAYAIISKERGGSHDTIVFLDSGSFQDRGYGRELYLVKFWGLADQIYNYPPDGSDNKIQPDFIISTRILPFPVISIGPGTIIVYKPLNSTENVSNLNFEPKMQSISDNTWVMDTISLLVWNPSQHPQNYTLTIKVTPFYINRTLSIEMNNSSIYQTTIITNKENDIFTSVNLTPGMSSLRLFSPDPCTSPSDVTQSTDKRCLSFKIINMTWSPE